MGILSNLFSNKEKEHSTRSRKNQPDVINVHDEDERMNWGIEKAQLTLHYFEKSLKQPSPKQQYFSIKVKIEGNEKTEHMWLTDPEFDEQGNLFGVVGNVPIDIKNVKYNQKIGIDRKLISDWMIIEEGKLIGGYTIRAIREGLNGRDLEKFDKSLGGMNIDEGEDHFKIDFETPEGAVLSLENAYSEKNIEKAIDCKDFTKEAEIMLTKTKKFELSKEIIDKTAEILKLSFIKYFQENEMPSFKDVKRAFPLREKVSDKHYIITEVCFHRDGNKSIERINTCKTKNGWKVLNVEK